MQQHEQHNRCKAAAPACQHANSKPPLRTHPHYPHSPPSPCRSLRNSPEAVKTVPFLIGSGKASVDVMQHRSKPRGYGKEDKLLPKSDDIRHGETSVINVGMGPSAALGQTLRVQRNQSLWRWNTSEEARRRKVMTQTEPESRKLILAAAQAGGCGQ